MTEKIQTTEPSTTIEWGVSFTWPDGYNEIAECESRRAAEHRVWSVDSDQDRKETAVLMSQTVTRSGWAPVQP